MLLLMAKARLPMPLPFAKRWSKRRALTQSPTLWSSA